MGYSQMLLTKTMSVSLANYFELIYCCCRPTEPVQGVHERIRYFFAILIKLCNYLATGKYGVSDLSPDFESVFSIERINLSGRRNHAVVWNSIEEPEQIGMRDHAFGTETERVNHFGKLRNFVKAHVLYWPSIFLAEKADSKQWKEILPPKKMKDSDKDLTGKVKSRQNLNQYSDKKLPTTVADKDVELENIVGIYKPMRIVVSNGNKEFMFRKKEMILREKEIKLRELEMKMKIHERGLDNWPEDVRRAYEEFQKIDGTYQQIDPKPSNQLKRKGKSIGE
ncbi:hypothetical protein TKK_0010600 [Trichogramma kaykai]